MSEKILTQERVKELFYYNPHSGNFIRRIRTTNSVHAGDVAGYDWISHSGKSYRVIGIGKKRIRAHRLAWLYVYGEFPEDQIDHINGNGLDNRLFNLREASQIENHRNVKLQSNNTSGFSGVVWSKVSNKWAATIKVNNKAVHLGVHESKSQAISARKEAELKYGFHPNHGAIRPL